MFVVGVLQDNTNSCQHAITIFRNWIYDSNEPYALPLSKESLDCCTWEITDGVIHQASLFVRFTGGWIFQEHKEKRKKVLDLQEDRRYPQCEQLVMADVVHACNKNV
jgi:hypothetical protein